MSSAEKTAYDAARYQRLKRARPKRPPDPLTKLTAAERAYLAGLIDGEGCIMVTTVGPKRKSIAHPCVCVTMASEGVTTWLADVLGVSATPVKARPEEPAHYRQKWSVRISGRRAQLLCEAILPYMRVKHRQAELLLTFPADARRGCGVLLDPATTAERARIKHEISELNQAA